MITPGIVIRNEATESWVDVTLAGLGFRSAAVVIVRVYLLSSPGYRFRCRRTRAIRTLDEPADKGFNKYRLSAEAHALALAGRRLRRIQGILAVRELNRNRMGGTEK